MSWCLISKKTKYVLLIIALLALALVFIAPVVLVFTNSLMRPEDITAGYVQGQANNLTIIPPLVVLDQYYYLLIHNTTYIHMLWNSLFLSGITTAGHIVIAFFTAYGFAKVRFPGRNVLFLLYILTMIMPFQVTLLPQYILSRSIGIYNTWWALVLPGIFAPMGVFLLRQFILYVPDELCEYFRLESNSSFRMLRHVILPQVQSGVMTLLILSFAENWNMVEQPLILLPDTAKQPLSIAMSSLQKTDPATAFAGSMVFMIPIFLLFILQKEKILNGLGRIQA